MGNSAIYNEVIRVLETEYEKMREVLLDDARIINEDIKLREERLDSALNEKIESAIDGIKNSIDENGRELQLLKNRIVTIDGKLDSIIKFQNSEVQRLNSRQNFAYAGSQNNYHGGGGNKQHAITGRQNKFFKFKPKLIPTMLMIIFLIALILISLIIYPFFFDKKGSNNPEISRTSVTNNQLESPDTTAIIGNGSDLGGNTDTFGQQMPQTNSLDSTNNVDNSVQPNTQQPEKSLADLKKEHETYAKALIHIATNTKAPEHSKLKELTTKISTADGLKDTTNSIISRSQRNTFSKIDLSNLSKWNIFNLLAVGAVEYIAAIKCKSFSLCDQITVDLQMGDITEDILTALNDSLPERFEPVPKVNKTDDKFQEFMAAVVLAHIMQEDDNQ
jgi:hypothetical protein